MEMMFAFMGVAFLTGGTFVASAVCIAIAGNAAIGAMKKKPDSFGLYITLSALCSSQGLYGLVGFMMLRKFIVPEVTMFQGLAILCLGLIMVFAAFYTGRNQAGICANGIKAIGEGHNVFAATMVLAVFPEFFCILALLVTILVSQMI
ncbi:MAG: ATPase [Tannerella sp.]|jgi:V/A-type H+-transporting ATPase subunit K|nr:ATPase [Tannerella sp.]